MTEDKIRWMMYKQENDYSNSVDVSRCRFALFEWHPYQCSRKPTTEIGGFGLCTQHAKIVRRRLERMDL